MNLANRNESCQALMQGVAILTREGYSIVAVNKTLLSSRQSLTTSYFLGVTVLVILRYQQRL